jgi:hypothetical protein
MYMKAALCIALLCSACDGGGAEVNLNQSQGQDQRPGDADFQPTPFDAGPFCEKTCNRRFNGLIEVLVTCSDGTRSVDVVTFLPRDCDTINEVTPVADSTPGGGVSGQGTH